MTPTVRIAEGWQAGQLDYYVAEELFGWRWLAYVDIPTRGHPGYPNLNCHLGDLKVEFDRDDPAEVEKAKQTIQALLQRGFVLMVEVDGKTRRVKRFDKKHNCYIVDMPKEPADAGSRKPGRRKHNQRRVPARSTRATAIAPRAGG